MPSSTARRQHSTQYYQLPNGEVLDYDGLVRSVAETVFNDDNDEFSGYSSLDCSLSSSSTSCNYAHQYPTRKSSPIYCDDDDTSSSSGGSDVDDDVDIEPIAPVLVNSPSCAAPHAAPAAIPGDATPTRVKATTASRHTTHQYDYQQHATSASLCTGIPESAHDDEMTEDATSAQPGAVDSLAKHVTRSPAPGSLALTRPPSSSGSTSRKRKSSPEEHAHPATSPGCFSEPSARPTKRRAITRKAKSASPAAVSSRLRTQARSSSSRKPASTGSNRPSGSRVIQPESSIVHALGSNKPLEIRLRKQKAQYKSEAHFDSEDDYDDPKDKDYAPQSESYYKPPSVSPSKRRVSSERQRTSSPSSPSTILPASRGITSPLKGDIRQPPSRNKPAEHDATYQGASNTNAARLLDWTCQECGWVQWNMRMPDFKRHLRSHCRAQNEAEGRIHICSGIPDDPDMRLEYEVPEEEEAWDMGEGRWRVAGCMRTFSRRDALRRHVCRSKTCLPDPELFPGINKKYGEESRAGKSIHFIGGH
ncbi:hypothetical protein AX16_008476 [Volvariella volvacea WC 439]|nr:hypothetical protein AX16_008476 [Volvariella volvacea WC 439]